MNDLPDRVNADLALYMLQQDRDCERADQIEAWRKRRESELECGEDPEAMYDALLERDEEKQLDVLWNFIFAANHADVDAQILAVREVIAGITKLTLDYEQSKGAWK